VNQLVLSHQLVLYYLSHLWDLLHQLNLWLLERLDDLHHLSDLSLHQNLLHLLAQQHLFLPSVPLHQSNP
jgi:hypothetical protein